jgi:hypothetical protein
MWLSCYRFLILFTVPPILKSDQLCLKMVLIDTTYQGPTTMDLKFFLKESKTCSGPLKFSSTVTCSKLALRNSAILTLFRLRFPLLIFLRTVPVPGSSYSSGPGSLHNFKNILKLDFFTQFSIETVLKQVDFNLELFNLFSFSDSF